MQNISWIFPETHPVRKFRFSPVYVELALDFGPVVGKKPYASCFAPVIRIDF